MKLCDVELELEELLSLNEKQKHPPDCANELCIFCFSSCVIVDPDEILIVISYIVNVLVRNINVKKA
jgi:hypothetical protein